MVDHIDSKSWRYDQQLFQTDFEGVSAGVLNFSAAWFMAGNEVSLRRLHFELWKIDLRVTGSRGWVG